jgi:hypothetical protein
MQDYEKQDVANLQASHSNKQAMQKIAEKRERERERERKNPGRNRHKFAPKHPLATHT